MDEVVSMEYVVMAKFVFAASVAVLIAFSAHSLQAKTHDSGIALGFAPVVSGATDNAVILAITGRVGGAAWL